MRVAVIAHQDFDAPPCACDAASQRAVRRSANAYGVEPRAGIEPIHNREALKEGGFFDAVGKTVQLAESRLFAFNPRLSYVSDNVAKANPSFWHPKTEMAKSPAKATKEMKTEKK